MLINPEVREALEKLPPIVENVDEPFEDEPTVVLGEEPKNGINEEGTGSAVPTPEGSGNRPDASGSVSGGAEEQSAGDGAAEQPRQGKAEKDGQDAQAVDELAQKGAAYDSLVKTLADNPVGFVQHLVANLTPEQRAALGMEPPQAQAEEEGWHDEELTEPEQFVKQHRAVIREIPAFAQAVDQRVRLHEGYIIQALNENAVLKAQLAAVQELLEVRFPEAKFSGYDPKAHEAYQKEVAKVATVKKASKADTPKTPLNTGAGIPEVQGGNDFVSLFKAVKRASA